MSSNLSIGVNRRVLGALLISLFLFAAGLLFGKLFADRPHPGIAAAGG